MYYLITVTLFFKKVAFFIIYMYYIGRF